MNCKKCGGSILNYNKFGLCTKCRLERRAEKNREYQKKYRQENKKRLDKYNLEYMRCRRWLDGSNNYSGELG